MIEVFSDFDKIEDLWGNINSKIVIFMDSSLVCFVPDLLKILDSQYVSPFIETFPSTLLLKQMFNEKIKIGNLILDKYPKIIILPSNEMKTLKDWDIILLKENYAKLRMFLANDNGEDICNKKIGVPNPEYSILGRLFVSLYQTKCKSDSKLIFSDLYHREIPKMLRDGIVDLGVLWEHEAKNNGFKGNPLNRTINLEIAVIKGADNTYLDIYKIMTSDYVKDLISKNNIELEKKR